MGVGDRPRAPAAATPNIGLYHPTFLYESLWDVGVAVLLVWAGSRFALRNGRLFALYVAAYTVGSAWIEALRVDHANHFLGLRLNDWTSLVVFLAAVAFLLLRKRSVDEPVVDEPVASTTTAPIETGGWIGGGRGPSRARGTHGALIGASDWT